MANSLEPTPTSSLEGRQHMLVRVRFIGLHLEAFIAFNPLGLFSIGRWAKRLLALFSNGHSVTNTIASIQDPSLESEREGKANRELS